VPVNTQVSTFDLNSVLLPFFFEEYYKVNDLKYVRVMYSVSLNLL
jgi:hypothetical protein